jgi:hypothetical protein
MFWPKHAVYLTLNNDKFELWLTVCILYNLKVVEWIALKFYIGAFHIVYLFQFCVGLDNLSHCFTWRPLGYMSIYCAVHTQFLSDWMNHIQFRKIKIFFVSCKFYFHKNGNLVLHGVCLPCPSNSATVKHNKNCASVVVLLMCHNSYVMHTFTNFFVCVSVYSYVDCDAVSHMCWFILNKVWLLVMILRKIIVRAVKQMPLWL